MESSGGREKLSAVSNTLGIAASSYWHGHAQLVEGRAVPAVEVLPIDGHQ